MLQKARNYMHNFFPVNYLEVENDSVELLHMWKRALVAVEYPYLIPLDKMLPAYSAGFVFPAQV